jgi:predicted dehydrogenase
MVRTQPQWLKVKEIVGSGRIGDLRLISGHFSYYRRDPADVRSRVEWGGGALMDVGCYPITISRWLFGAEPTEVVGLIDRDPEMKIDRLTSGLLRFESGQATFSCAMQLVAYQAVQIFGTKGRIAASFHAMPSHESRILVDDGSDLLGNGGIETITFPPVDQFSIQADRFSKAIRGVGTVPVSLEDAIGNMAVIDALFRSAESHRWERPS